VEEPLMCPQLTAVEELDQTGQLELVAPLPPPASQPRRHLPALTGLRFVLAIWVVMHHLTGKGMLLEPWAQSLPPALGSLVRAGYLAVGTFFVLSGFVMARSYGGKSWNRGSLMRFGMARIARIYPGYLLSLLIVSPYIYHYIFEAKADALHKAALLADYGCVLQGWTGSLGVGWNTPAWSLSCEFFFYLCFPVLLIWFGKRTRLRMTLAVSLAILLPVALAGLHVPSSWKPLHHMADFLVGMVASHSFDMLSESKWIFKQAGLWMYSLAASAGALIVAFPGFLKGVMALNTALLPVNFALLVGLAIGGGLPARVLSSRVVKYLGEASYSMYILHVPLLWWYSRYLWQSTSVAVETATAVLYIAGVIVVSAVAFELVEQPANRLIRGWAKSW
jgi:peptidoglycan/LPS O-acetylase OafA/YrhL